MKKTPVNLRNNLNTGTVKALTFQMLLELECKIDNPLLMKLDNQLCQKYMKINLDLYKEMTKHIKRALNEKSK